MLYWFRAVAKSLTAKQEDILNFLVDYVEENGYPPSIREIGTEFKISSLRGVTVHLDALQRKGYIARSNTPRSIKVTHPHFQRSGRSALLPLIGTIAAGVPITAEQNTEDLIPVPIEMVKRIKDAFLLRIRGDSMTGEGIMPRDLVVIKPQREANHGDLVAFMIDGEATVKRLHRGPSGVRLIPANAAYTPIEVNSPDSFVIGKVIGLIRDYEGLSF